MSEIGELADSYLRDLACHRVHQPGLSVVAQIARELLALRESVATKEASCPVDRQALAVHAVERFSSTAEFLKSYVNDWVNDQRHDEELAAHLADADMLLHQVIESSGLAPLVEEIQGLLLGLGKVLEEEAEDAQSEAAT